MANHHSFKPGQIWLDTEGNPIRSHGGGMLEENGVYYWFGEMRDGFVSFPGISCYRSTDLFNWMRLEDALTPVDEADHDLHQDRIVERPKVIRNPLTGQYVMWMHIENRTYSLAHAGVAVSDRPEGPYRYIGSCRPNGAESRDMTLYQDEDGSAYLIHASANNATLQINLLSEDYLSMEGTWSHACPGLFREAPAVFKHDGIYYLIASGCTGFSPNASYYAVSDSMLGEWKLRGSIARGTGAESTFHSQPTFALPVRGRENAVILMGDRWRHSDLSDTRHVWLPILFEKDGIAIEWLEEWNWDYRKPGVHIDKAEGEALPVGYVSSSLTLQDAPLTRLDQGDQNRQKASARFGWNENEFIVRVQLEGEALQLYRTDARIWDQDHVWLSLGHFQYSFALLPDGTCHAEYGTYLDHLGIGTFYAEGAADYLRGQWRLVPEGMEIELQISRQSAPLPTFGEYAELPLSIAVARQRDQQGRQAKAYAPAGWIWGDPRTYFKAILLRSK